MTVVTQVNYGLMVLVSPCMYIVHVHFSRAIIYAPVNNTPTTPSLCYTGKLTGVHPPIGEIDMGYLHSKVLLCQIPYQSHTYQPADSLLLEFCINCA